MAEIKLTYFNARGLAESLRWILEFAGAKYEDVRVEREAWPQLKESKLTRKHHFQYVLENKFDIGYTFIPEK